MIIFDTETTGLVEPEAAPIEKQPRMIEFAAIKLNSETLEEISRMEFLCHPGKDLPPQIVKITGITDSMLKGKKSFAAHYHSLVDFFIGEKDLVAHNCQFDVDILRFELERMGKLLQFPWPSNHICTVEKTLPIKGHRLSLTKLHEHLFGEPFPSAHRAMVDVEALTRCVIEMRKQELM